jgi:putative endonuclease
MTHHLYIVQCTDNNLYTGVTDNLNLRIKTHNKWQGPNFTRTRLPVKLVYFEKYDNLKAARHREKQIKGWRREKKENLIKYGHPNKNN